ncbi:hypothetical protein ABOZ73_00395 [Caulobacter sp. 73W]|uniref:Polymerase nucleotidyl transferase domain-containing protein n=1 Tax=Caulobacter sp. 73W TaxID=3161137 RepID=A0AB39KSQ9_9CAUL
MSKPKDLSQLPTVKRRELDYVVEVLREEFAKKTANRTSARLRDAKILKIILYGSYARGDWASPPSTPTPTTRTFTSPFARLAKTALSLTYGSHNSSGGARCGRKSCATTGWRP